MTMPETRAVIFESVNPYFNLAAEEYMLTRTSCSWLAVWQNEPSVIVGVNQNTQNEINEAYVREHGIKVVRRMTGGGAVFHDLGNINYSFVESTDEFSGDYAHFSRPVINALEHFGINAHLSGRNDLLLGTHKISGAAQCTKNGRVLHHGTLLYSADLCTLENALTVSGEKLEGKGIKSVRSRVTDISRHIENPPTAKEFMHLLFENLCSVTGAEKYNFTPAEAEEITALAEQKYKTEAWNFTRNLPGSRTAARRLSSGVFSVSKVVCGNVITAVSINGDFLCSGNLREAEKALEGVNNDYSSILCALQGISAPLPSITPEELAKLISDAGI